MNKSDLGEDSLTEEHNLMYMIFPKNMTLQLYLVTFAMNRKKKLIARFLSMPSDFRYDEMVILLGYFDFEEVKKGKSSGSRVRFMNPEGVPIMLHKPHPSCILKHYQLKQIKEILDL